MIDCHGTPLATQINESRERVVRNRDTGNKFPIRGGQGQIWEADHKRTRERKAGVNGASEKEHTYSKAELMLRSEGKAKQIFLTLKRRTTDYRSAGGSHSLLVTGFGAGSSAHHDPILDEDVLHTPPHFWKRRKNL